MTYALRTLVPMPTLSVAGSPGSESVRFSKQLALIIYLAARPECRASREELAGLLYGGSSSSDARQAIRQLVYQIRRSTDSGFLAGEELLSLQYTDLDFDVTRFRERLASGDLEGAADVYQADFLASVSLPGAREFELWAEGLRQQLAAERRQLLRSLIARERDAGQWRHAACHAQALVEADPHDLEPRLQLIELLALAGDVVRARAEADATRRLATEVDGERATRDVEEAIAKALAPTSTAERRGRNGLPSDPEMVGRAAPFRAVVESWRAAQEGRGSAVLIRGEAGIGKTKLVQELVRRLRRDRSLILSAQCFTIEQSDPAAPFLGLVAGAHAASGVGGASPASLAVLAAFVPEIAQRFEATVRPRDLPVPPEALAQALVDAFAAIADEVPLVLAVEDLHWAPSATAELAHRLARGLRTHRVLLLLTARDSASGAGATEALRELTDSGVVSAVELEPLDPDDVHTLLASMATVPDVPGARTLASRLHSCSDGIPLYVLAVLKALHDQGVLTARDGAWELGGPVADPASALPVPQTTEAILQERIDLLPETARQVLTAIAVCGRSAPTADLAAITGLDEEAIRDALDTLLRRRQVSVQDGEVAIGHEEIAAAVLRSAPHADVASCHSRAADLAEARALRGQPSEWGVAARHAAATGDVARAASLVARAASVAETQTGSSAGAAVARELASSASRAIEPDLRCALAPLLAGRWSATRWLDERSGAARRRRRLVSAATLAGLAVIGAGLVFVTRPQAIVPVGGGYVAVSFQGGDGARVEAYRLDSSFALTSVPAESLPLGVRLGFTASRVSPDGSLALATCTRPDMDAVHACGIRLANGDTVFRALYESDTYGASWSPDGRTFAATGGYLPSIDEYRRAVLLFDSSGRVSKTLRRDGNSYEEPRFAPHGTSLAVRQDLARWVMMDLEGGTQGTLPAACLGEVRWSPDGRRLACSAAGARTLSLISADSLTVAGRWDLPGSASVIEWSPDGRYVLATVDSAGTILYVLDAVRLGTLVRVRHYPDSAATLLGWVLPASAPRVVHPVIGPESLAVAVGEEASVAARGVSAEGRGVRLPLSARWTVADSLVARVDRNGVLTGDRTGRTMVYVGWGADARDSALVVVEPLSSRLLLAEHFEGGLDTARWRPFGHPAPRVARGAGAAGTDGFHNNGDYSHSSGIAWREWLPTARGLTVAWSSKVPLSVRNWQWTAVRLAALPADSFYLRRSGPTTERPYFVIVADGPRVGEGFRSAALVATGAPSSLGRAPLPRFLLDGEWHRYRLAISPAGEVRWFADGVQIGPAMHVDLRRLPRATLAIEGQSVGGLVLVDDVAVWQGVVLESASARPHGAPASGAGRAGRID